MIKAVYWNINRDPENVNVTKIFFSWIRDNTNPKRIMESNNCCSMNSKCNWQQTLMRIIENRLKHPGVEIKNNINTVLTPHLSRTSAPIQSSVPL